MSKVQACSPSELASRFQRDVNDVALMLIRHFGLRFREEQPDLSDPLLRWIDFRFRYIDPKPRQVVWSDHFPKPNLPAELQPALHAFVDKVEAGLDLNPYQGRGLVLRNDVSGSKRVARTDLLWAEWGIHHFHLSGELIPEGQFFSRPADYLAFCLVFGDVVAVIDILRHPDVEGFSNPDLIETVARSWPDLLARFRLRGVRAGGKERTQREIHELRVGGVTTGFVFGEDVNLGPGRGITAAGTSAHVGYATDRLRDIVDELAAEVAARDGGYRSPEIESLGDAVDYCLGVTPKGLAVIERTTNLGFLLPSSEQLRETDGRAVLCDLLLPDWALEALRAQEGTQG